MTIRHSLWAATGRRALITMAILLALILFAVPGAQAESNGGAGGIATTTTPSVPAEPPAPSPADPATSSDDATGEPSATAGQPTASEPNWAIGVFVLGAVGLLLAWFFYDRWRKSYESLALAALEQTHVFPPTIWNEQAPGGVTRSQGAIALEEGEPPPEPPPAVAGPPVVTVGQAATFTASKDGTPLESCEWTVEPAEAASVSSATGAQVTLTAKVAGAFTLTAKAPGGEPRIVHLVAVEEAEKGGGGVPLLGGNFAGVAVVILAITIAGALSALGELGTDAFIAFIGPIVGYFFVQAQQASTPGSGSGGSPSP